MQKPSAGSRQAVPGRGDFWGDEQRRPWVGAQSALRSLTRRGCPNAAPAGRVVSSAAPVRHEHVLGLAAVGAEAAAERAVVAVERGDAVGVLAPATGGAPAASPGAEDRDGLADRDGVDARADRVDVSGVLMAEDEGHVPGQHALHAVPIDRDVVLLVGDGRDDRDLHLRVRRLVLQHVDQFTHAHGRECTRRSVVAQPIVGPLEQEDVGLLAGLEDAELGVDRIFGKGTTPDEVARKLEVLAGHCADLGRDPATIENPFDKTKDK